MREHRKDREKEGAIGAEIVAGQEFARRILGRQEKMNGPRLTGTVKLWRETFGFIIRDDGGPDVFVHQTKIQHDGWKMLEQGQRVEYSLMETPKGPQAIAVIKI